MGVIKFKDQEFEFVVNNYTVYKFGMSVGAKDVMTAIGKLAVLKDGYSFEGQEAISKLIFAATKEAITLEDCFELSMDVDTITALGAEVEKYIRGIMAIQEEETEEVKKKETEEV